MNVYRFFRGSLVALSTVGLFVSPVAQVSAAERVITEQQTAVTDVALQSGGVLQGQVVDAQGVAQVSLDVTLETRGAEIARTTTDDHGYFAVENVRGGTYVLRAGDQVATYRVWAANTAPPSATPGLLVVTGNATRAQMELVRRYGTGAVLVLGGMAAVIAISVSRDHNAS